jgi:hypothetical protein
MSSLGEPLLDLEEDKYAKAVIWGSAEGDGAAVDRPGSARGEGVGKAAAAGIGGVLQGGGEVRREGGDPATAALASRSRPSDLSATIPS